LYVEQFGFKNVDFMVEMVFFFPVRPRITPVPDKVDRQQQESQKGSILQHPDFRLQGKQELDVLSLAVNIETEEKQEQMEGREDAVKDDPVVAHGA